MKKFGIAVALIVLAGAMIWFTYPIYSWHQKLTLEVETPDGLVTGSSVIEMIVCDVPNILRAARELELRGEATIVKLPKGRYLFALLNYNAFFTANVFEESKKLLSASGERWAKQLSRLQGRTEPRAVPRKLYPLLVTFGDIKNPISVRAVAPDDLAATFGPGYHLKRMTLEITGEPITKGRVEKLLGWLSGEHISDSVWSNLSPDQRDLLSSRKWKKGVLQSPPKRTCF